MLLESGVCVIDTTKEEARNIIGIRAVVDAKTTVTGMCAVELDEWPILQEVGARIFAADTAPLLNDGLGVRHETDESVCKTG